VAALQLGVVPIPSLADRRPQVEGPAGARSPSRDPHACRHRYARRGARRSGAGRPGAARGGAVGAVRPVRSPMRPSSSGASPRRRRERPDRPDGPMLSRAQKSSKRSSSRARPRPRRRPDRPGSSWSAVGMCVAGLRAGQSRRPAHPGTGWARRTGSDGLAVRVHLRCRHSKRRPGQRSERAFAARLVIVALQHPATTGGSP